MCHEGEIFSKHYSVFWEGKIPLPPRKKGKYHMKLERHLDNWTILYRKVIFYLCFYFRLLLILCFCQYFAGLLILSTFMQELTHVREPTVDVPSWFLR
jgi:hypothetical protein